MKELIKSSNLQKNALEPLTSITPAPNMHFFNYLSPYNKESYANFTSLSNPIGWKQPFSISFKIMFGTLNNSQTILQLIDNDTSVISVSTILGQGGIELHLSYTVYINFFITIPQIDVWYTVGFTWDGQGNASTYLDGNLISTINNPVNGIFNNVSGSIGIPNYSSSFYGGIDNLYIWNTCLSGQQMAQQAWAENTKPMSKDLLLLGYDFSTSPPTQIGGSSTINCVNLSYFSESPALMSWAFNNQDIASAGQATSANPGGGSPFSILAWILNGTPVLTNPKLTGTIFSNGDISTGKYLNIYLDNGQIYVDINTNVVSTAIALSSYQWYYIGVTYDGSDWLRIYINNVEVASQNNISGLSSPSNSAIKLFGVMDNNTPSNPYQGFIQFLSVWNTCLNATQIQSYMYEDPTLESNCTANFMCSDNPCVDSIATTFVQGSSTWGTDQINLNQGDMYIENLYLWYNNTDIKKPSKSKYQYLSNNEINLKVDVPKIYIKKNPIESFSNEHKDLMINEFKSILKGVNNKAAKTKILNDYIKDLDEKFSYALKNPNSLIGPYVYFEEIEGFYQLYYCSKDGEKTYLDFKVDISAKCAAWWASFLYTAITGLLSIFGIDTPASLFMNYIRDMINNSALMGTLATIANVTFTGLTFLQLLLAIYEAGYLVQILWILAGAIGWWAAAAFIAYVIKMITSASPATATAIAYSSTTVTNLITQLQTYSQDCGLGYAPISKK
ncbi:MAG: LamG domain-containing protein [Raineya sp.]|jgi:hypothetical protein|nr:LamG domain-containing protein [Raineya sp.]